MNAGGTYENGGAGDESIVTISGLTNGHTLFRTDLQLRE